MQILLEGLSFYTAVTLTFCGIVYLFISSLFKYEKHGKCRGRKEEQFLEQRKPHLGGRRLLNAFSS